MELRDKNTLLSASLDGEIRQWNVLDESLDFIIKLPGPVTTFILNASKETCYAVVDMDLLCVIDLTVIKFSIVFYYERPVNLKEFSNSKMS